MPLATTNETHEFAVKYNLPIIQVVRSKSGSDDTLPYIWQMVFICNSESFEWTTYSGSKEKRATELLDQLG